jgi:hypothetical protein
VNTGLTSSWGRCGRAGCAGWVNGMAPTVLSQIVPTRSPPHWFDIGVQVQRTDGLGVHRLGAPAPAPAAGVRPGGTRRQTEITDGHVDGQ